MGYTGIQARSARVTDIGVDSQLHLYQEFKQ